MWPTAKGDVVSCELLVYGESVVMPENEPDVADVPRVHVHGQTGPGLMLWSGTCSWP